MTDQLLADAVECAIGLNVDCGGTQGVHRVRDAVLAALEEHLDLGEAEAWCKTCRRVWDGKGHQCESAAEAAVARIEALAEEYPVGIDTALIHEALALAEPAPKPAATDTTEQEKTTRVIDLYERWLAAGPPPLGTSISRWWDRRLIELHNAIRPAAEQPTTTVNNPATSNNQP